MSDKKHYETQFVISMMPGDLEQEVRERYLLGKVTDEDETTQWWMHEATRDAYEALAYYILNDDALWQVWDNVFQQGLEDVKKLVESDMKERDEA
jgi:hypothetical protein